MKLKQLKIAGFKSIDTEGQLIDFDDVTVLIGANGTGKSNLISFFKMLNCLTAGTLQTFVGEQGYADALLHYGPQQTPRMQAEVVFEDDSQEGRYSFTLGHASGDTLIFTEETIRCRNTPEPVRRVPLGVGHKESLLLVNEETGETATGGLLWLLRGCQVYQFHDTSSTAKMRNQGYVNAAGYLRNNADNLAAYLYAMRKISGNKVYYQRIVQRIQEVMPQFDDFWLEPSAGNDNYIRLDWKDKGSDHRFGPHQLSDGSLRFMALTTLLLQPPRELPNVIVVDEPELGLHPAAIASLASMVKMAAQHSQVILATQSPRLLDEFEPEHVVVVEREEESHTSIFKRLERPALDEWLQQYCLSELWEKNVFGGQP
jgi:predicted ATPase